MKTILILISALFCLQAMAEEKIGSVSAGGMFISDELSVLATDDPDIKGVTCYVTFYDRSLSLNDSSESSIACRKVGPISGTFTAKNDVFSMNKTPFFKTTVVSRFYDAKRKVLIYLSYTKNSSGKNAQHSISVVPVEQ